MSPLLAQAQPVWMFFDNPRNIAATLSIGAVILCAGALILLLHSAARRRERLTALAIERNQPQLAAEIVRARSPLPLWIIGAAVAIVLITTIHWVATFVLAVMALALYYRGKAPHPHRAAGEAAAAATPTPAEPLEKGRVS